MLGENIVKKELDKGIYKGYKIVKEWSEKKGKILAYTIKYIAYSDDGHIVECRDKLKSLKKYIDSIDRRS